MPTMTETQWNATKVPGRKVRICYGELCDVLDFDGANEFALEILNQTGYQGVIGGATNSAKVAAPKGSMKGTKKGGKKGC